ncbi:MAG TPA: PAS domain S-box protein [candidate division Zixibacteria bacterium]|nr:PAS domain S-box protein [candidate division Zixibacteria bacterium]
MLTPLVAVLAFLICAFFYFSYQYQSDAVHGQLDMRLQSVQRTFLGSSRYHARQVHQAVETILMNDFVAQRWCAKDTTSIKARLNEYFSILTKDLGAEELYFSDTAGNIILRWQTYDNPEVSGQCLTMVSAMRQKMGVEGLELDEDGRLKMCVVHPWEYEGRLIGYIQIECGTEWILKEIAGQLNIELAVLIKREQVDPALWTEALHSTHRLVGPGNNPDYLLLASTIDNLPADAWRALLSHSGINKNSNSDTHFFGIGKREMSARLTKLLDSSGQPIGEVAVMYDYTEQWDRLMVDLRWLILVSLATGFALFLFIFVLLSRFEKNLSRAQQEVVIATEREIRNQRLYLSQIESEKQTLAESEEALRRSRSEIMELLSNIPANILEIDRDGLVVYANRRLPLVGSREELQGSSFAKLLKEDSGLRFESGLARVFQTNNKTSISVVDSSDVTWHLVMLPLHHAGRFDSIIAVCDNLSEVRAAQERLEWLEHAVTHAHEGVAVADLNGQLLYANNAWLKMHGRDSQNIVGINLSIFHTPRQLIQEVEPFNREVMKHGLLEGDVGHMRNDGTEFPCHMTSVLLTDDAGTPVGFVGLAEDTTEQKQVEAELWESQIRFERLVSNFPGMVYQFKLQRDGTMTFPWVSRGAVDIFGTSANELMDCFDLVRNSIPEDDIEHITTTIKRSAENLSVWEETFRVIVDGRERFMRGLSRPRALINGDVLWDGVMVDVTEQQHNEEKLTRALSQLEAVLDSARQVAIIAVDEQGVITLFNRGAERLLGYDADQLIGHETACLFYDPQELADFIKSVKGSDVTADDPLAPFAGITGSGYHERRWRFFRKDGQAIIVKAVVSQMPVSDHRISGYLLVAVDVSEQVTAEASLEQTNRELQSVDELRKANTVHLTGLIDELRAANRQAEETLKSRSLLLARLSHKIRKPLKAMSRLAERVLETNLTEKASEYVETISEQAERLVTLMTGLLDITSSDSGRSQLEPIEFSLEGILRQAVRSMRRQMKEHHVTVSARMDCELPTAVMGDPDRLLQVLVILLDNAVHHAHDGSVMIEVARECCPGKRPHIRFSITDSGSGFHPSEKGSVFQLLTENEPKYAQQLTGVGLPLAARLVNLLGGEIWVDDSPRDELEQTRGGRVSFTADLLLKIKPEVSLDDKTVPHQTAQLISEKVETIKRLERLLQTWGVTVVRDYAKLSKGNTSTVDSDIVLIDEAMFDSDKLEIHSLLNGLLKFSGTIVLTDDKQYQSRPGLKTKNVLQGKFHRGELYHLVRQVAGWCHKDVDWHPLELDLDKLAQATAPPADETDIEWGRVLIIDRDDADRKAATGLLTRHKFDVTAVSSLADGLKHLSDETVDLVILDIDLARATGPESIEVVRDAAGEEHHPMLVIAAPGIDRMELPQWLSQAIDETLTKPYEPAALISLVKRMIQPGWLSPEQEMNLPSGFDESFLLEQARGDYHIAYELIGTFTRKAREYLAEIERELSSDENERLYALISTLGDEANEIGFYDLSELTENLRKAVMDDDTLTMDESMKRIERLVKKITIHVTTEKTSVS